MRYFAYGVLIASIVVLLAYKTEISHTPNEGTRRACMEYALRDHEKEFNPKRWEYLKTLGNPNDVEFWYSIRVVSITTHTLLVERKMSG